MPRALLRVGFVAAILTASAVPLVAGWGNDAIQEPSSVYDSRSFMWPGPNDRTALVSGLMSDRVYFNAQLSTGFVTRHVNAPGGRLDSPTLVHADALLGYWRDCNNDGYIGNKLTGQKTYVHTTSPSPVDTSVCPAGSIFWHGSEPLAPNAPYNRVCCMVHEFVDIGPWTEFPECYTVSPFPRCASWSVPDDLSRVWGDIGLPGEPWVKHVGFRDAIAENPAVLLFYDGTFDSWNGHLRYVDGVTIGQLAATYAGLPIVAGDLYATPLATQPTPLRTVRYQVLTSGEIDNDWSGRPLVRTWECTSPDAEPALAPGVDSGGSVVDSANNTAMGARTTIVVPNPAGPQPITSAQLFVGPGCDGSNGQQVFNQGLVLPHPEDETLPTELQKVTPDWFFQYRAPLSEPRNQLAAWGTVPRADRTTGGTWYAHQMYFNDGPIDRDADYYTFYAYVSNLGLAGRNNAGINYATFQAPGASGLPGARVVNGVPQAPSWTYGAEACGTPSRLGWDCTNFPGGPFPAWEKYEHPWWGLTLAQPYNLRDVDCTDFTIAAPNEEQILKDNTNALWEAAIGFTGPDVSGEVGTAAFSEYCR